MNEVKKIAIKIKNLNKSFPIAKGHVEVLKNINLNIEQGKFTILIGPSGCGKSTLLHTILGLEKPTSGSVEIFDTNLYLNKTEDQIAEFRMKTIGMVYQQPNWIKSLNVIKNIEIPLTLEGINEDTRMKKAKEMISLIGMTDWLTYYPSELSSGQQQKISLIRALISNPNIIIADEPTGNLDFKSGEEVLQFLKKFNEKKDKTILMVTHDLEYLKYADVAIKMFDGQIQKTFNPQTNNEEMSNIYKSFKINEIE